MSLNPGNEILLTCKIEIRTFSQGSLGTTFPNGNSPARMSSWFHHREILTWRIYQEDFGFTFPENRTASPFYVVVSGENFRISPSSVCTSQWRKQH